MSRRKSGKVVPSGSQFAGNRVRIACHNPFGPDQPTAERELAARIAIAGERRGWTVRTVHSAAEIEAFSPDLVVSLHYEAPKTTGFPTFGCLWNPPVQFEDHPQPLARSLSYDGFLTAGASMRRFVEACFFPTHRIPLTAPFYPTTHATALPPRIGPDSRLFYVGSNWDGRRFEQLFELLAQSGLFAVFGPGKAWSHLGGAYVGTLPFDGHGLLSEANRCGIGLCLHLADHTAAGLPNMRIFELAAAGTLIICGRHPFVEEYFGDTVLTIDMGGPVESIAQDIVGHVVWARANPDAANAMAIRAQNFFLKNLALEQLMDCWPDLTDSVRNVTGFVSADAELVQFVLPVSGASPDAVRRTVECVAGQSHRSVELIVVGSSPDVEAALKPISASLRMRLVSGPPARPPGAALWAGLHAVDAPWFGLLNPGTELFPNHVASLLEIARRTEAEMVFGHAMAEVKGAWRPMPSGTLRKGELPGDRLEIPPAAFLMRSRLLTARLLRDPGLDTAAALYLIRRIAALREPVSSWLVTLRVPPMAMGAAERGHLERLERCDSTLPAPASVTSFCRSAPMPPEASGANLLADVPCLYDAAGFAKLRHGPPVYIYGTSRGGRLVQLELMKHPDVRIAGFLDSRLSGTAWEFPVRIPTELPVEVLAASTIIVASEYVAEIVEALRQLGQFSILNAYPYIKTYTAPL